MEEKRFAFGKNWKAFLQDITDEQISIAETCLTQVIQPEKFQGKTFLDIGSGSGIFSLIAHRLGAQVFSFDYDRDSVGCTQSLKEKYAPHSSWHVEEGSILDKEYLRNIPKADIVYSWGVLHSTNNMYQAFENITELVKPHGLLFISIYNDLGDEFTERWIKIKKAYVNGDERVRNALLKDGLFEQWGRRFTEDFFDTGDPLKTWNEYKQHRGMSAYYDLVDWVGGYPYEVAKPEAVTSFFEKKGFALRYSNPKKISGCNEFLFEAAD